MFPVSIGDALNKEGWIVRPLVHRSTGQHAGYPTLHLVSVHCLPTENEWLVLLIDVDCAFQIVLLRCAEHDRVSADRHSLTE